MKHLEENWTEPSFWDRFRLLFFVLVALFGMILLGAVFIGADGLLRLAGWKSHSMNLVLDIAAEPVDANLFLNQAFISNPSRFPVSWERGSHHTIEAAHPACFPESVRIAIPVNPDTDPQIWVSSDYTTAQFLPGSLELVFRLRPEYVQLSIESRPPGADISIDGLSVRGTTPMSYSFRTGDTVTLTARKDGYETAVREIHVADFPTETTVVLELRRKPAPTAARPTEKPVSTGTLQVSSDFPVNVFTGNRQIVRNQKQSTVTLPTGSHRLRIVNASYLLDLEQTITVRANRTFTVKVDPPGKVFLESNPAGAQVVVDSVVLGHTPGTYEVYPGLYNMVFRFDACDDEQSIWVRVVSNQTRRIPSVRGCQ